MFAPKKIGLIFRPNISDLDRIISIILAERPDISLFAESKESSRFQKNHGIHFVNGLVFYQECEFVLSFGGDGTMLYTASLFPNKKIPILGINLGNVGFLAEGKLEHLQNIIRNILPKNGQLEEDYLCARMRLSGSFRNKESGEKKNIGPALNEFVIRANLFGRLAEFKIENEKGLITNIRCDGLIVATPTGSTAYNLAAGGPIIDPKLQTIILTPICAHDLSQRPIVFSGDSVLRINLISKGYLSIIFDGNEIDLGENQYENIEIKQSEYPACIITLGEKSFFDSLNSKLNWGKR